MIDLPPDNADKLVGKLVLGAAKREMNVNYSSVS